MYVCIRVIGDVSDRFVIGDDLGREGSGWCPAPGWLAGWLGAGTKAEGKVAARDRVRRRGAQRIVG